MSRTRRGFSKHGAKEVGGFRRFLCIVFIILSLCCFGGLFLLYGPIIGFRDWLITTAMETMNHQYLATWFYDDETIQECLSRNRIIAVYGTTDTGMIEFVDTSGMTSFENEYEEQVLKRSKNNNDYKIIQIKEEKFTGYLAVIYDASRVKVAVTSKMENIFLK